MKHTVLTVLVIASLTGFGPSAAAQSEWLDSGHSGFGGSLSYLKVPGASATNAGVSFSLLGWGDIGYVAQNSDGSTQSIVGLTVLGVKQTPRGTTSRVNAPFTMGLHIERANNIGGGRQDMTILSLIGYRRFDLGPHSFFGARGALGLAKVSAGYSYYGDATSSDYMGGSIGADLAFDIGEHLLWVFNAGVTKFEQMDATKSVGVAMVIKITPKPKSGSDRETSDR